MRKIIGKALLGAIVALVAADLLLPSAVFAQPPVCAFYGTAKLDGKLVADGTLISAWIEGEKVGETPYKDSRYILKVVQPSGADFTGKTVTFKVGQYAAAEASVWEAGEVTRINLNAVTAPPKLPDLVIPEIECDREGGRVGYVMKNIGRGVAPAGHHTTLWVEGEKICEDKVALELKPGATHQSWFKCYAWPENKTIEVKVCADGRNAVKESDEENNCGTEKCIRYPRWDIDRSGKVNSEDLAILAKHYGESTRPPYPGYDINQDGRVDYKDLAMLGAHYGEIY